MAGGSGVKTNEREGTRAVAKYIRISPFKVREVLDLIRGQHVQRAAEILRFSERDAAQAVGKVLGSAIANAENNDAIDPEELFVSACYADEGVTIKRFRPRARGRAGKIFKRTCHITVIVSRMPDEELRRHRARTQQEAAARRARRVAGGRRGGGVPEGQESTDGTRPGRFRRGGRRGGDASEETALLGDEAAEVVEEAAEQAEIDADETEAVESESENEGATEVVDEDEAAVATEEEEQQ